MNANKNTPWWRSRSSLVLIGFLVVAGFFLISEHRAHFFGALPYLLILACPLMHFFHHHGNQGGQRGHDHSGVDGTRSEERRGGKECVSTCSSGWGRDHKKK